MSEEEMREGQGREGTEPESAGQEPGPEPAAQEPGPQAMGEAGAGGSQAINRMCACMVQAERVEIHQGGAMAVVARDATVTMGGSVIAAATNLTVDKGGSQWLLAGEARVQNGGAGIMVTQNAQLVDTKVGILLAGKVEGNVQAVMDTESALRFGAALGATLGVALLLRRLVWGR
ncbi:MAG TPA: hypothetical protein VHS28_09470 [Chloroflexota bacterium]|nr:hypothetical protein [Chloroflexota bacterium]